MNRPARALRIDVRAQDPVRRQGLLSLVSEAGHEVVASPEDADVIVCDLGPGETPPRAEGSALLLLADQPSLERNPSFAAVLPRQVGAEPFQAALAAVAAGLVVRMAGAALPEAGFDRAGEIGAFSPLTPREIEILTAIGEGLSNKEVARRLGISAHTVKFHLEAIFEKLGAGSRAEAVAKGLRRGVIEL